MKCVCIALVLVTAVAAVCVQQKPKLIAIVSVNSGLKNPQWEITEAAAFERIRDSLKSVPAAPDPRWPIMGWRGFLLMNEGVDGLPAEIQVLRGVIRLEDQTGVHFFKDIHGLESWLQQQAEARGFFPKSSAGEQQKPDTH